MHYLAFAALTSCVSSALVRRQSPIDNTQPVGSNPVSVNHVDYLGEQHSTNSCTHRDLGFTGPFAGTWYAVYGDTLYCEGGVSDPDKDPAGLHGMVRDALARLTDDPLNIEWTALNTETPVAHPNQV